MKWAVLSFIVFVGGVGAFAYWMGEVVHPCHEGTVSVLTRRGACTVYRVKMCYTHDIYFTECDGKKAPTEWDELHGKSVQRERMN